MEAKSIILIIISLLMGLAVKPGVTEVTDIMPKNTAEVTAEITITDMKIPVKDITDFYYTYEDINYGAVYQRYRFYTEDGKYMFFHERRERPDDYGPATEEDVTAKGTVELTEKEWLDTFEMLGSGTVQKRKDSGASGDSGPWTYIYWKDDKSVYQEYSFASYSDKKAFEEYCQSLAKRK